MDQLTKKFPELTPYQFASNSPIEAIDLDGAEAQNVNTGAVENTLNPTTAPTYQQNLDYKPWKDLLTLKTPQSLLKSANARFYVHDFTDQPLSSASGGLLNTDYYSVQIQQLPSNFKTAGALFDYVRRNLNTFMKGGGNSFEAYDNGENTKWLSSNPTSSILRFKGYVAGANIDDADVATAKYSYSDNAAYWIFKPVADVNLMSGFGHPAPQNGDASHPLAGYRQFGIVPNTDNGFTFYTRGVDRAWSIGDALLQGVVFSAADVLWKSVMNNVAQYVIMNGGKATVPNPISRRIWWRRDISPADKQAVENAGN